ncbi:uncharacterized protein LOC131657932 [Vicia villosa]|uniref:uncharacterized protein LOC131657932 n=1 Tax=Vicia villosa TaxID=3911 RepID=UPI00273CD4FA|nr:uncharacterized protein LOC131657932 [Vicia villosa]
MEWNDLEMVMEEMSFPAQFTRWIMIVVKYVSYRYLINGQMNSILEAKRGLRQGDLVSPLLFVLIMEYFHRCLTKLQKDLDYNYHPKCAKLRITNVCFADDLLLFFRGDVKKIQLLMAVFKQFFEATELTINPAKCIIYFRGTQDQEQHDIMEEIHFTKGRLPFKYLGVPLSSGKLTISQCQPVIDKMVRKIQHWSTKLISYAGRQQLVKSVLMNISGYWMQVFPMPKTVIKRINTICHNFPWSRKTTGKKAHVAWEDVCQPKNVGGLNLKYLEDWNKVTMLKILWNLHMKTDKL